MTRISEIFDDWKMADIDENLFDTLEQETEERILKMALKKIHADRKAINRKKQRKEKGRLLTGKKLTLAILVAALVGTLSVIAQGLIRMKDALAEQFKMETEMNTDQVIVENILEEDGTSAQSGGVTVRVEQILSDGEDAYGYFTVELPESLVLEKNPDYVDEWWEFRKCEIQIEGKSPQGKSFMICQDDSGLYYGIVHFEQGELEESSVGVSMTLNNICRVVYTGKDVWSETVVEGQWNLNWTMICENMTKTFAFEETVDANDGIVTTEEIVLSPLSVKISGTIACDDPTYSQVSACIDNMILQDGTLVAVRSKSKTADGECIMKSYFERMIPMEEIVGVVINGEYYYFYRLFKIL